MLYGILFKYFFLEMLGVRERKFSKSVSVVCGFFSAPVREGLG
jgi:hypothetical protein